MPAFPNAAAYAHAVTIVTAGLQSGSIKLRGPQVDAPEQYAQIDAKYLNELINAIAKNLQTP